MSEELKSCRRCNQKPKIWELDCNGYSDHVREGSFNVECLCSGYSATPHFKTKTEAVQFWNNREAYYNNTRSER